MKGACSTDIFTSSWISLHADTYNKQKQDTIEGHPLIICPSPAQGTIFGKNIIQVQLQEKKE